MISEIELFVIMFQHFLKQYFMWLLAYFPLTLEPGAEDEEVYVNPEWVHIEPILDFFLQLIVNEAIDVRMLKGFVTHSFV